MTCTVCNSDVPDVCEDCHQKAHETERARLLAIVMAEYKYWRKHEIFGQSAVATGACANIIAAFGGQLSPWHPKTEVQMSSRIGRKSIREIAESLRDHVRQARPYSCVFVQAIPPEHRVAAEAELKEMFDRWANSWIVPLIDDLDSHVRRAS